MKKRILLLLLALLLPVSAMAISKQVPLVTLWHKAAVATGFAHYTDEENYINTENYTD